MGKFTKVLEKARKEHRASQSVAETDESASKQPKQPSKNGAQTIRQPVIEPLKTPDVSEKKVKKSVVEKAAPVSTDVALGSIHSLLEDSPKSDASEAVKTDPADNKSPFFEAPGIDLSEDSEKINVPLQLSTGDDESKITGKSSEPGSSEQDLSSIEAIRRDRKTGDASTALDNRDAEKENEQLDLDSNRSQIIEPLQKDMPADKNVIPITKNKGVKQVDRDAIDTKRGAVGKKHEPPDVALTKYKPSKIDTNLVALMRPDSFEAEQFRMLRSNLLFPRDGKPPRTILVTSAVPHEGKSFISTNLAITFALDIQTHVLLVDCDIRKPHIHSRFGYESVIGLSEYLTGKMDISAMLLNTNVAKLKILPGGKPPKNPAELLSSKRMSNLLLEVKSKYPDRYIILDSPPPKLTAETNVLSRQVDGILLVAKYGSTRREDLRELIDKIGKEKILGIIINWFDLRASRYYGRGKYSGYKYYYGKMDK